MRRITALAAATMLGVTAPAAARLEPGGFEATLTATLDRSWSWRGTPGCLPGSGSGRRLLVLRAPRTVRVGAAGGTIPVVGVLTLSGRATTFAETSGGSCEDVGVVCPATRTRVAGLVRVRLRAAIVRLTNLRYGTRGRVGCAPEIDAVHSALQGEPRLDTIVVRDRAGKLRNPRIPRVTVRAASGPSAEIVGEIGGRVETAARWTLTLKRR